MSAAIVAAVERSLIAKEIAKERLNAADRTIAEMQLQLKTGVLLDQDKLKSLSVRVMPFFFV